MRCTLTHVLTFFALGTLVGCQRAAPPAPGAPGAQSSATTSDAASATPDGKTAQSASAAAASPDTRGFETPEAAFAAMQAAVDQKDWRTAAGCLTNESQETMTGGLLLVSGLMAVFGGDQAAELTAVMQEHGIEMPEPSFDFSEPTPEETSDSAPEEEAPDSGMPDIQDKAGFIEDMLTALEKMDEGKAGQMHEQWAAAELQDLEIDGESATAKMAIQTDEGAESQEIAFRQGEGGWLVHLPEDAFGMGPGGLPGGFAESPGDDAEPDVPLVETVLEGGLTSTLSLTFEKPFTQQFFDEEFPDRTLFGTLNLVGEPILNAYEYGEFRFNSVTDDTGAALELAMPLKDQFDAEFGENFIELNAFFLDKKDTLPIVFALTPPAEGAKTVTIQASCKLKVRDSLVVKNVLESIGGELQDERLAELGTFTLKEPDDDNGQPGHGLVIEVKAPEGTVEGVTLLNGQGQPLDSASGSYSFGFGSEMTYGISAGEELPADTQLRITLGGTEKIQVVPLNLEASELP